MTITEEFKARRDDRQLLTDRLTLEYGGAVSPGQVLAAVLRADRLLASCDPGPDRTALCETLVRHQLAGQASRRLQRMTG